MKFSTLVLVPFFAATYVAAHGELRRIAINGKNFEGNTPGAPANPSVIRQVSSQDPNKGANNPALTCGPNSGPAALVADVNPGDKISFNWRTASDQIWVHDTGPMLTYMASCGSVTCDKFDQTNAKWFKIDQVGRKPNSDEWFQKDLHNGGVADVTIPANIKPGNYLVRHEIIALHLATSPGGAEFYPGCVQLKVGGNGNGVPKQSDLVSIPGAYSDNDPGIFDPDTFNAKVPYQFPGPALATLVPDDGSPAPSGPASPASTPAAAAPQPSGSPAKPKSKSCKKRPGAGPSPPASPTPTPVAGNAENPTPSPATDYRRRRYLGHIMRRFALENSFH